MARIADLPAPYVPLWTAIEEKGSFYTVSQHGRLQPPMPCPDRRCRQHAAVWLYKRNRTRGGSGRYQSRCLRHACDLFNTGHYMLVDDSHVYGDAMEWMTQVIYRHL